jgi:asparagine synthase (glutamine-hydrolysing)
LYGTGVLRARLESRGHQFRSRTDTEILIHLYEDEGTGLFRHVNGMFAFAIHDRGRKRLLLARDRLGVKPLFYAFRGGELLFGSELKAVFTGLGGKPPLRADVLGQYILQGYASSPDTLFEGVWSLPPGHYLDVHLAELEAGRLPEPVEYWDAPFTGDNLLPAGEAEEELGDLLGDAVRIRMVADVPVGAFLSGGIDSGAVVALMSRVSDRPVRTFTVDLPGTAQRGGQGARRLAEVWDGARRRRLHE